jgi:hypothetical protein
MLPRPRNYEMFRDPIKMILKDAKKPLTWTEIRVKAGFEQRVPNPRWVKWMEEDIGLIREKTKQGIILWRLG